MYKTITHKNPRTSIIPPLFEKLITSYVSNPTAKFKLSYQTYEEKKSDVNMALAIYRDATKGVYDKAMLITGDNDIAPAIRLVKADYPNKEFMVLFPPGGKGHTLKQECHKKQILQKQQLQNAQLPNPVIIKDPRNPKQHIQIKKPLDWI